MKIPKILFGPLAPLASQVGGMGVLEQLPFETLIMAVNHSDDVLGVSFLEPDFEIFRLDQDRGYEVFNKHYMPLYTETELIEATWGNTKNDRQWIAKADVGDWAYLRYYTLDGTERIAMLIRM